MYPHHDHDFSSILSFIHTRIAKERKIVWLCPTSFFCAFKRFHCSTMKSGDNQTNGANRKFYILLKYHTQMISDFFLFEPVMTPGYLCIYPTFCVIYCRLKYQWRTLDMFEKLSVQDGQTKNAFRKNFVQNISKSMELVTSEPWLNPLKPWLSRQMFNITDHLFFS